MKIGIVKISHALLKDKKVRTLMFGEIQPLAMEEDVHGMAIKCICDRFDDIKEPEVLPVYDFIIAHNDGILHIAEVIKL